MSQLDVIQSHVEELTRRYLGLDDVVVDDDGGLRWRDRRAGVEARVRTYGSGVPHIRVTAIVARLVGPHPDLLHDLSHHNARLSHARLWLADTEVLIGSELHGWSTDLDAFRCLCAEVSGFVNEHAAELAREWHGFPLFDSAGPEQDGEDL